ncbi:cell envelope integrity protein TolA [Desulfovibrionales bacterium]
MSTPLRSLSWVFSLTLHILVALGGVYFSPGSQVAINLDRRVYEVDLVGPANKGKPGTRSVPKLAAAQEAASKKTLPKEAPPEAVPEKVQAEQKKPAKKAVPADTATPIPQDTVNATKEEPKKEEPKEEVKKEEPKKEEPKKEEPKKEEPKKEEPKKQASETKVAQEQGKNATKAEKTQSKEDVLAQALGEVSKQAKGGKTGSAEGSAKGDPKGSAKNALADALAAAGREVSGRAGSGDGSGGEGPGEGESMGTLDEWYATQVVRAIRQNWRFPRMSNVVLATTVELRVNQAGEILSSKMMKGSGRADFDASVMRAISDTKQLPPLPESLDATFLITFYNTENE